MIRLYSERGVSVINDQMEQLYIKYHRELYLYAFSLSSCGTIVVRDKIKCIVSLTRLSGGMNKCIIVKS